MRNYTDRGFIFRHQLCGTTNRFAYHVSQSHIERFTEHCGPSCIIHWDDNHFIVIYKVGPHKIYVSDPAKGLLSYSHEEFTRKWYKPDEQAGVILALEPTANFMQMEMHEKRTAKNF